MTMLPEEPSAKKLGLVIDLDILPTNPSGNLSKEPKCS